ncbi:MAG: hypothetical protein ACR2MW_08145, partial [Chthoniobacterales bacterium]
MNGNFSKQFPEVARFPRPKAEPEASDWNRLSCPLQSAAPSSDARKTRPKKACYSRLKKICGPLFSCFALLVDMQM